MITWMACMSARSVMRHSGTNEKCRDLEELFMFLHVDLPQRVHVSRVVPLNQKYKQLFDDSFFYFVSMGQRL